MRKSYLALLLMFLLGLPVWAGTVVGVDTLYPPPSDGFAVDNWPAVGVGGVQVIDAYAVAWYQPFAIYAWVSVNFQTTGTDNGGTFNAYLTSSIGGLAGPGEEDYNTTFTLPAPDPINGTLAPTWIGLFDGVYLLPGVHYLTIGATENSSAFWSSTLDPAVTLVPGFLLGDGTSVQSFASGGDVAGYPPASNFSPMTTYAELLGGQDENLMFDVSVPEPGTIWMLGGALSLALLRRKRSA